jgi:acyl-coenzyme A synthetase/AMP-(fatty) acid ligase
MEPIACVVPHDGTTATSELSDELQRHVISRLPAFKRTRWIEFLPDLPKTATGKIQRFKLRTWVHEALREMRPSASQNKDGLLPPDK